MKNTSSLRQYQNIEQLPALQSQRTCTDIFCIIISLIFATIMIIISAVSFNYGNYINNYIKSNFPADSSGLLCGVDLTQYPYLYFANLPQINRRLCVQSCPKSTDKSLKCHPTDDVGCRITQDQKFTVRYYQSRPEQTRGGYFCWPVQVELENKIYQNSNLQARNLFYNSIDTIINSVYVALAVSIVFFVLVQAFPYQINFLVAGMGSLLLFVVMICVFCYKTELTGIKIVLGCVLITLLILSGFTIFKHRKSLFLHGIYLKWSRKLFMSRPLSLVYILIFMIIFLLFVLLIILQFVCIWTSGDLEFNSQNRIYYELHGTWSTVLTVCMCIQLIWGLTFIKQAFNFCISGNSINWFLEDRPGKNGQQVQSVRVKKNVFYPLKIMFTKHLGSVIASSFMNNGLFVVMDWMFDILKPMDQQESVYGKIFMYSCGCLKNLVDFVRSDSLAYINLTGNPYCNSSRYCELLCQRSKTVQFSQSSSRIYRLNAHILIMGLVGLVALYMKGNISIYALIVIFIQTIFISTLFITYHADTAEAIQVVVLTIQELYCRNTTEQNYQRQDLQILQKLAIRVELFREIAEDRQKRK